MSVKDESIVLLFEELHRVLSGDPLRDAHSVLAASALGNAFPGLLEHDVEVHAEDSGVGVVFDAQVDVLLDAEPEVAGRREVLLAQLELLALQSFFQDLLGLIASHSHVHGDLLVSLDAERPDRVFRLAATGRLSRQIFYHLSFVYLPSPLS